MHCPYCRNTDTRVLDSRVADDGGAIRRRRSCPECGKRFTTVEQMQLVGGQAQSGATEPFTRDKAIAGVRKACKGRPVTEDDLARLGQQVEDTLRGEGRAEVPAHEVGMAILGPLRELDEVAYLRFASVYQRLRVRRRLRGRDRDPARRAEPPLEPEPRADAPPQPDAADPQTARRTSWGSGAPGAPATHDQQSTASSSTTAATTTTPGTRGDSDDGDGERRSTARQQRRKRQGPEDRAASSAPRACTPTTRSPGSAATSSRPTGRPARPSSSSAAWSSPTSGRSTPPRSSPRSTSAAPSAPTSASGASSSSSTGS